ncbi:MAG: hypothetical protein CMK89_00315 [Pseudomonadales bacterium]|nr:hypothetical protein [Pseudomonadales bacterium]
MNYLTRLTAALLGLIVLVLLLITTMIAFIHYLGPLFGLIPLGAMLYWYKYLFVYVLDMFWLMSPEDFKEDHTPFWQRLGTAWNESRDE